MMKLFGDFPGTQFNNDDKKNKNRLKMNRTRGRDYHVTQEARYKSSGKKKKSGVNRGRKKVRKNKTAKSVQLSLLEGTCTSRYSLFGLFSFFFLVILLLLPPSHIRLFIFSKGPFEWFYGFVLSDGLMSEGHINNTHKIYSLIDDKETISRY